MVLRVLYWESSPRISIDCTIIIAVFCAFCHSRRKEPVCHSYPPRHEKDHPVRANPRAHRVVAVSNSNTIRQLIQAVEPAKKFDIQHQLIS